MSETSPPFKDIMTEIMTDRPSHPSDGQKVTLQISITFFTICLNRCLFDPVYNRYDYSTDINLCIYKF